MSLFSRIVIIGVGLIGGSLGLAIKKRQLSRTVIGIAPDEERLQTALRLGAVDKATTSFDEGINADADATGHELIIVATPVSLVADYVHRVASAVQNTLITDVGSTKETICARLEQTALPNGCRFVGSHPIAGKEKSGVEHADADLFENRLAIVTPTASASERDTDLLLWFWHSLGSQTANMSPAEHDRVLARTSHLPHLLSAVLAERLQVHDIKYTGPGYHGMTRLAAGLPELWRDIVTHNAGAIVEAIRDYEHALGDLREKIEHSDWEAVAHLLEHAKKNRDTLKIEATQ
jgi:prephenate dehydrogenase